MWCRKKKQPAGTSDDVFRARQARLVAAANAELKTDDTGVPIEKNVSKFVITETQTERIMPEVDSWRYWPNTIRKCFVEFLGDFLFIFLGSMSAVATSTGLIGGALTHGLCIFVLIASLGHISGGHFNPAVTLGVAISGAIHPILATFYVFSQLLGGFVGALFLRAALTTKAYAIANGGTTHLNLDHANVGNALVTSVITSFFLVNTVLLTAVDTNLNILAPLAIGLSITVDALAAGQVSGASMNPARSFGPAIAYSIFHESGGGEDWVGSRAAQKVWEYHYIYWIGPLLGGTIAGLLYNVFLANKNKRWVLKY